MDSYIIEFKMIRAMIFEISSASFINSPGFPLFTSMVSLIKHSQYFVSLADFREMFRQFFQSFCELPAFDRRCASYQLVK
jgi:hypothetical protein